VTDTRVTALVPETASLEDLFLKLTAGPESKELIERLLAPDL